jgi:hypothetical protein
MKKLVCVAVVLGLLGVGSHAFADGIYGDCYGKGGEKCAESNHTISTSWNAKKAYPDSNGRYSLDLGGKVGSMITVYCDGSSVGSVRVDGDVRFNVHCR